jgi:hypothetical protein
MSLADQAKHQLLKERVEMLEARVVALEEMSGIQPQTDVRITEQSPGWFNVTDDDGNVLNAGAMRREEAERFASGATV